MSKASDNFKQMGIDFQNTLKSFFTTADTLSKNKLLRVCKALAAHPLEDNIVELNMKDEQSLYNMGKELQSIKLGMMVESLKKDAEDEARRQQIKNKVPDNIEKPDYA